MKMKRGKKRPNNREELSLVLKEAKVLRFKKTHGTDSFWRR
jgi:hypothetical protein